MADAKLLLHCGAREVTCAELAAVPCPKPERHWGPVPHVQILDHALYALVEAGYEVEKMSLGLARGDARFFGTLTLRRALASGVSLAVGVRSSLDKSISLQWACGHRVVVCDNMAFRSEKVIARKHTVHGVLRYREAIGRAVSELSDFRAQEAARIEAMTRRALTDAQAESTLLRCYEQGVLSPRTIFSALKEWREPSFGEFADRTAWSLFNAVTYAISNRARSNPQAHAALTIRLGALLSPSDPHFSTPA